LFKTSSRAISSVKEKAAHRCSGVKPQGPTKWRQGIKSSSLKDDDDDDEDDDDDDDDDDEDDDDDDDNGGGGG
jgi:hypothetical protein